ncbi:type IV pilin biogenesis protein [Salmonella enterica subsp. enterica]|uniref:Type IV pilin biogenesis protein n=1 Tax=Salmonella enterica I TaxID=59201 RepID=A0A379WF52_SALET|nr:type IV pilin biogenesis protein [Salmonella enterica subsp. enterica]
MPALQTASERSRGAIAQSLAQRATALAGKRLSALLPRLLWPNRVIRSVNRYPALRQLIASGASAQALEAHLQQTGTGTLFENGCRAVEQGMTSFEEILRVLECPMSVKQLWRWQGVNDKGQLEQDVVWRTIVCADHHPAHQRIMPLRIKRMGVNAALWKEEQSAEIIHQLATLIHAGLTLLKGWNSLRNSIPTDNGKRCCARWLTSLNRASLFQRISLLAQVFPPLYQTMIRTGELTGKLAECCFELARQQKAQRQITVSVKKALRYPAIILTMAALVVFAMLHFVLPEFAAIYRSFNTRSLF